MAEGGEYIELGDLGGRDHDNDGYDADEHTHLLPGDETQTTSTSRGTRPKQGARRKTTAETSFGGLETPVTSREKNDELSRREKNQNDAWRGIRTKYPTANPTNSPFTARMDGFGQIWVRMKRVNAKEHHLLNTNGELNPKAPKSVKYFVGPTAEAIIETL